MTASSAPSHPPQPFVTRRSTLVFAALVLGSTFAYEPVAGSAGSTGPQAMVAAALIGVYTVTGLLAWTAGLTLALRSKSLVWLAVACIPPPIGAVLCALWAPQPKAPSGNAKA